MSLGLRRPRGGDRRWARWTLGAICATSLLTATCGGPRPLVERFDGATWAAASFQETARSGQRDGTDVTFTVELQGASRLTVEGLVRVDPGARLVGGSWTETGGALERAGTATADSIDFLGGQGGRPSVGGRLTLADGDGTPVYRLNLPTAPL